MRPTGSDPFEVLGLEPRFDLDAEELRRALLEASRRWHPDQWVLASAAEQHAAERRMSEVNEAFARLADPIERAAALLERFGHPLRPDRRPDPDLLAEVFELREEADEAAHEGGERLRRALDRIAAALADAERALADAFARWAAAGHPDADVPDVLRALDRVQYLRRTLAALQETRENPAA